MSCTPAFVCGVSATAIRAVSPPSPPRTTPGGSALVTVTTARPAAADSPLAQGSLSHLLGTVQIMETGQPSGHETAIAALVQRAVGAAADSSAAAGYMGVGGPAAADSPPARGSLSHPLSTVQIMGTRQSNGHETATAALPPPAADTTADAPAAGCEGSGGPAPTADSPSARGSLSHPLSTVQPMGTGQ